MGQTRRLSDYRGRWVVLYFYPKDDTPGCRAEAIAFESHREDFAKAQAVVLGVSIDDEDSHRRFADRCNLTFSLLADKEGAVIDAYSARGLVFGAKRLTYVIDPAGTVAGAFTSLSPTRHPEQALGIIHRRQG